MDVVYCLGPGRDRAELRFSLRSLRNVPHGTVWIAGADPPEWVTNVRHIAVAQNSGRYINTARNIAAACTESEVSGEFLMFDADMFIMKPIRRVSVYHRGTVTDALRRLSWASGPWRNGLRRTAELCRQNGVQEPLCYEVHTPMPVNKQAMAEVLGMPEFWRNRAPQKRTAYGNLHGIGGSRIKRDPKVVTQRGGYDPDGTFLSTRRWSGDVVKHIQWVFPEPSEYERRG